MTAVLDAGRPWHNPTPGAAERGGSPATPGPWVR
jgi:hypothetical protein